ncbi:MAG: GGDEF domain-containing protein [Rubrobacter sp.]|nr:GGDEF domain-containing protein [Rubrobacter sp.]
MAEPAPKAASDEVRWLPQGRLLLAALAGTATAWGAMGLILVVAALVAWKLPTKRTTRSDAERWGMPTPYYGAEATYRNVPFAYPPGSLGGGDTRDARKRAPQAPEALGHKPNGDASAGSRVRKAADAGRGRTRRAKKVRELALIVLLAACAYATVVLVNAHERFERWASSYEKWQVDELPILLGFVAMAAFVFAWRRWRETNADLARRKDLHRKLEHRATHDALTDLPNRAMFMDRLQHATERTKREQTMLAVLFIDLDGFKAVNDAFGHAGGDQLLKQVAGRLRRCARSADTVSRIGGDEFIVLLEGVKDVHQDVVTVARRIAKSLVAPYVLERGEVSVGSSIGVTLNGIEMRAAEDLLREADNAMYRAKGRAKHATRSPAQSVGLSTNGTSSFFVLYSPNVVEEGFSEPRA